MVCALVTVREVSLMHSRKAHTCNPCAPEGNPRDDPDGLSVVLAARFSIYLSICNPTHVPGAVQFSFPEDFRTTSSEDHHTLYCRRAVFF